jgi:serine/threonine protein kinase
MEQVRPSTSAQSTPATCTVCQGALEHERCGHCGAAAKAGPYTIKKLLSQNAQGRVYLAADEGGAEVALKELVYTMVPSVEELEAFTRETALLEQLSHPRIPRFVKGFTVGTGMHTRLYLAQQLVRGESLEQRLTHHRFSEAEVTDVARQVLEILAFLNDRRPPIVHRDLKPANLIVSPEGQVHLIDFGTARDVKAGGTHRSTLVGTVGYMAPEQLGGTVSHQSDLYGLGATLAHLLTRKPPEQLLGSGMTIDVQQLGASPGLRGFLAGLLAPRAADRYPDAHVALRTLVAGVKLNRTSRKMMVWAVALSATLSLLSALAVLRAQTPAHEKKSAPAVVTQPPARAVVARPQPAAPPKPGEPPYVKPSPFSWHLASWEFDKPGPWLLDTTGHGYSVPFPASGYSIDFFGLVWDGTQPKLVIPDAEAFAVQHPFVIDVSFNRMAEGGKVRQFDRSTVQHFITRGDPNGRFAWDVSIEGDLVKFRIMDEEGNTSTVSGLVEQKNQTLNFYAQFDPETGDQWLHAGSLCQPLDHKVTQVRPAKTVPNGALSLIDGFQGNIRHINLSRGLMLPNGEPGQQGTCGYSGAKLSKPSK